MEDPVKVRVQAVRIEPEGDVTVRLRSVTRSGEEWLEMLLRQAYERQDELLIGLPAVQMALFGEE